MMREYLTVSDTCSDEFTEKKSRFIGYLVPVDTADDASAAIAGFKKKYWDASHNCSAFIVGPCMETMRFSDDGEPQGTAGVPMLETLKTAGLTNVLAVVTRYFGGTLLGTGGLVRAYSKGVSLAISRGREKGLVVKRVPAVTYRLTVPYSSYGKFENIMASGRYYSESTDFADSVFVSVGIPVSAENNFIKEITEAFCGSIVPEKADEKYITIPL